MAIQGEAREKKDFSPEIGLFEAKVVAVNPTKEQLEKLLGTTIEKEPEYIGEDANGKKRVTVVFYLQDVKTKKIKNVRFYLKDVVRTNKDNTKTQYINQLGGTSWTDSEENLPDWFKNGSPRPAHEGEEQFYKFASAWLNGLKKNTPGATLEFDFKKLINGNVKEITEQIGGKFEGTVVVLSTVRKVDSDGDSKEYEQIYNQEFMPGYAMSQVRMAKVDDAFIEVATKTDRKKRSWFQSFVLAITDKQYGVKEIFTLTELDRYIPGNHFQASDKVISEDDSSY